MKEFNIYKIAFENMKGENEEIFVFAENEEEAEDMFKTNFWYDDNLMELAYKKFINVTLVKNPVEYEIENSKHWAITFGCFGADLEEYYHKLINEKNK
ncbi:MAG: hypothetical protein J5965_07355 [Aeriscardovia sp.]|nr:hypothetical protein [Aeriscardovia sp.]